MSKDINKNKGSKSISLNDKNTFVVHRNFTGVLIASKSNLPASALLASALFDKK